MFVKNISRDDILTEYNGKRYVLPKGTPVEMPEIVYRNILLSRFIDAQSVVQCEVPTAPGPDAKKEAVNAPIPEKKTKPLKKKGRK